MTSFTFGRTPTLYLGAGRLAYLPEFLAAHRATRIALVTGARSFRASERFERLAHELHRNGISVRDFSVAGEPTPELVDEAVAQLRDRLPDAVVAIGGGSVIDGGKAISAMVMEEGSVVDYLEEVGSRSPTGKKLPFVALPTTAGTGSEATRNAVMSRPGAGGFKKSLRHENYVPDVAIIDPKLALDCPPGVTAASGLDAITQLLEGYVSAGASPLTDALARSGLRSAGASFERVAREEGGDLGARAQMGYAAFLSGVVLANAGLGVVHGIASPLGGRVPVPHGVVCGTLLAEATRVNIERLSHAAASEEEAARAGAAEGGGGATPEGSPAAVALSKYADAGALLTGRDAGSIPANCDQLVSLLQRWIDELQIPRLAAYGISQQTLREVARQSGVKGGPVKLSADEIYAIMAARL